MTRSAVFPAETVALLGAVAGALLFLARRRPPRWVGILRGLSAAVLALLVFRWVNGARGPRSIAVVFDYSASMGTPAAAEGETRWSRSRRAWSDAAPPVGDSISAFVLGDGLFRRTDDALARETPAALRSAFSRLGELKSLAPDLDGVVFFSDGRGEPGAEDAWRSLGIPVLAVAPPPDRSPDIAVESVQAPATAIAGAETPVTVRWRKSTVPPGPLRWTLWSGERRLAERSVTASTETEGESVLSFRPSGAGATRFRVEVDGASGEKYFGNNARTFFMEIQRDRLRVLYLCGRPGPHYAFLRAQLKTDPAVDLVSFVILRDPEDAVGFPETDLSLIPFPTAETLMAQLKTFNVVILENFPLTGFGLGPRFAAAVGDYVEKGGGLLLAGEGRYWANGGPGRGNALEAWLPPDRFRPGPEGRWSAKILPAAKSVLFLDGARWSELPPLESAAGSLWPDLSGGVPLIEAPGGASHASARAQGRGRLMVLSSLTDWRWALGANTPGPWLYQRFWENVVRWLGESPDRRTLRIDRPEGPVTVGAPWPVAVRFTGVQPPSSVILTWRSADGSERHDVRLKPESDGVYTGALSLPRSGMYDVSVRSPRGGDRLWVEAASGWDEFRDVRPAPAALTRLAAATGGEVVDVESFTARRFRRWRRGLGRAGGRFDPPGPGWWWAVLALWVFEWALRKRRGER